MKSKRIFLRATDSPEENRRAEGLIQPLAASLSERQPQELDTDSGDINPVGSTESDESDA